MRKAVKKSLTIAIVSALAISGFSATTSRAAPSGQSRAADEQNFKEFEQIVADFAPADKIQAWEAFLQKYPGSSCVPKVRDLLAELKGEKPRATPVPSSAPLAAQAGDTDLEFMNDKPAPTPRPAPTTKPVVASLASPATAAPTHSLEPPRMPRPRPSFDRGIERSNHFEIAPWFGIAPDETYVRNMLFGLAIATHLGRTWSVELEGATSQASETPLLHSLRKLTAEPEVISKYNFIVGAAIQANLLSARDPVTNAIGGRNDLYVLGAGGALNADLEICKQSGATKCAAPLFVNGVNFTWFGAGVGHRFYFTRHLLFRSEVRGRLVLELIDNKMTPRPNVQINVGPSFVF